ncbi:MAG: ABC transporter ATP-binding protein [bacterium]
MKTEEGLAIRVQGLRKQYRLGVIGGGTLRESLQSWWAKKRGREDPNSRIGVDTRLYGQTFWALNGVDLTVRRGERLGIIGANGAGKSTLLKLLARITGPTEGEIEIWGRISSMLEVGTGFHRELTGRENIYMNGAILGMTRGEITRQMDNIIEFSEAGEFIDTPVKRYSSGMFVRLAFAVAAHLNSEIMIMDEVLAVGDMAFQDKCLARMRQAADDEGKTILYVSHNMDTIRRLCERCVVMDQGKIIFDGAPEEAIRIYMRSGLAEDQVVFNLEERSTNQKGLDSGLRLRELRIVGKDEARYQPKEAVRFQVRFDVSKPIHGAKFRLVVRNETDTPLGTSWTPVLNFPESGCYALTVDFPLSQLNCGTFYCDIGFFYALDGGGNLLLDNARRAFRFEVTGPKGWTTRLRGYFALPESAAALERL